MGCVVAYNCDLFIYISENVSRKIPTIVTVKELCMFKWMSTVKHPCQCEEHSVYKIS